MLVILLFVTTEAMAPLPPPRSSGLGFASIHFSLLGLPFFITYLSLGLLEVRAITFKITF